VWMGRRRGGVLFTGSSGLLTRSGSVGSGYRLKDKVRWASGCVRPWCWSDVEGSSSATLAQGRGQQRKACGGHGDGGAGKLGVVVLIRSGCLVLAAVVQVKGS
jgi:hypothetical protein